MYKKAVNKKSVKTSTPIPQGCVLAVMANTLGWRRVAEIGVRRGGSAQHLLTFAQSVSYVGVDLWEPIIGDEAVPGFRTYSAETSRQNCDQTKKRLKEFRERVKLVKTSSIEAAKQFKDASFDCVFIDADHRYEHVRADIAAWRPKVKKGGWLTGHDIIMPSVRQAVETSFSAYTLVAPNVWGVKV